MSGLNESEKLIIKFLQKNNSISNKEAAILTKFSPAQIRRIFTSLKKKELIIAKSNGRNRHYVLSDNMVYIQNH